MNPTHRRKPEFAGWNRNVDIVRFERDGSHYVVAFCEGYDPEVYTAAAFAQMYEEVPKTYTVVGWRFPKKGEHFLTMTGDVRVAEMNFVNCRHWIVDVQP